MLIRAAAIHDLAAIEALRRHDADALGFIPLGRYETVITGSVVAGRRRADYETLTVVTDDGEVTGFTFAGFHRTGVKIEQICVRVGARRIERATALVRAVEVAAWLRGAPRSKIRVAADLAAVQFWEAVGYTRRAFVEATFCGYRKSWSRRPLLHYERPLHQLELIAATIGA